MSLRNTLGNSDICFIVWKIQHDPSAKHILFSTKENTFEMA